METKRVILVSCAINLYFLVLCAVFGNLRFGAVDDIFMSGILSGIYGDGYNVHMTFVNVLYGYCLLPLYHLFPKINWYYVGEMLSIFVSLSVIDFVIIKKVGTKWGLALAALFTALCASDYYLVLQFTQCAAMLSAAGMLAFVYGLCKIEESRRCSKKGVTTIIVGILLLWWGSWMRWDAFLMGMPFFACALLVLFRKLWKVKLVVIAGLLALFAGAWGFHEFDRLQYAPPGYKQYMDFQGPRALLGDGRNYNQQAVYEDIDEMGYSGKDYASLTEWTFYDNHVFAPESIRIVTDVISRYYYDYPILAMPARILSALENSCRSPLFILWVVLCLALFVSNSPNKKWPWLSLFIAMLLIAYLLNLQRLVYRVETGIWLYAACLAVPWLKGSLKKPSKISILIVIIILLSNLVLYISTGSHTRSANSIDIIHITQEKLDTADYKGLFHYMDSTPDSTVFIFSMNSYMRVARQGPPPYLAEPQASWERIFSFGYWTPYFPDVEKALRNRGVSNPMRDVVLDNVFVIDEPGLVDFLERHYYNKVKVDTVRNFNGMVVYKYSLASDSLMGVEE